MTIPVSPEAARKALAPQATLVTHQRGAIKAVDIGHGQAAEWLRALTGHDGDHLSEETAYAVQGWFRRCVATLADAVADMPWEIHELGAEMDADPLWSSTDPMPPEALMPYRTMRRFLFRTSAALTVTGTAYALKTRDRGQFTGLQWWRPSTVQLDYSGDVEAPYPGIRRFYRAVKDGAPVPYDPEDVLMVVVPDPFTESGVPSSDGRAARVHADVLQSLDTFLDGYLDRGLLKATLLTTEQRMQPDQKADLRAWWKRMFGGKANAGEVEVINAGIVPVTIGDGLKDLDNVGLTNEQREAIANAVGVPFSMVKGDSANFATAQVEETGFYLRTGIPRARIIAEQINEHWLMEEGLQLVFKPKKLPALQRMQIEMAESVVTLTGRPVWTAEEGRIFLDMSPEPTVGELHTPQPPTGQAAPGRQPVGRGDDDPEARMKARLSELLSA